MKKNIYKKGLVVGIIIIFFGLAVMPAIETSTLNDYPLPPPTPTEMILEQSIFRRSSIRDFTDELVTDEDLSTVLWAAYGYINNENRTVHGIDGIHAAHIYVLKEDAVYKYHALNHSLIFYKTGDYRDIGQYDAPIQIGLVWDKNKSSQENYVAAEIGQIGQNIQLMANALDLGTVVTVGWPLAEIGLPSNEVAKIIMPLGHPKYPYDFIYLPLVLSFLPRIKYSNTSLTTAIEERNEAIYWEDNLTKQEQTQAIWSSYGFSYLFDNSESSLDYYIRRHRTVPSAHGYYPLQMYAVTETGIYRCVPNIYNPLYGFITLIYEIFPKFPIPVLAFMLKIRKGDHREEMAQCSSQPSIASAPLLIISVLNLKKTKPIGCDDFSGEEFRWLWYFEAGASAYNVLLEATAWNLSANIVPPTNIESIRSLLKLNDNFIPLLIMPVGK